MNEITKIHLGRQAFTISVDAYKELQEYLHSIKRAVGEKGQDVVKEIEMRMAELLAERGVTGDKVILQEDITFLKTQLGKPGDFRDDDEPLAKDDETNESAKTPKRLFRDTENGMIAGVAAGLAAYTHISPWLVRVAFVFLTLAWGWGILAYIVLWLIVPEASSSSNRLQMEGKPVTVASLKHIVDRADVPGATKRASKFFGKFLEKAGKILLGIVGVGLMIAAAVLFMGAMTVGTYSLINGWQAYGETIFPIGTHEVWIVLATLAALVALSVLLLFIGLAMTRRKWSTPGWVVAALIGLFLAGSSISGGLTLDAAPNIAKRVDSLRHTKTIAVDPFQRVSLEGNATQFSFEKSDRYEVELRYEGNLKTESFAVAVHGDSLAIDTTKFEQAEPCRFPCLSQSGNVQVIMRAPLLVAVELRGYNNYFSSDDIVAQPSFDAVVDSANSMNLGSLYPEKVIIKAVDSAPGAKSVQFTGLRASTLGYDYVYVSGTDVGLSRVDLLQLIGAGECNLRQPFASVSTNRTTVKIDDLPPIRAGELQTKQSYEVNSPYNCVHAPEQSVID